MSLTDFCSSNSSSSIQIFWNDGKFAWVFSGLVAVADSFNNLTGKSSWVSITFVSVLPPGVSRLVRMSHPHDVLGSRTSSGEENFWQTCVTRKCRVQKFRMSFCQSLSFIRRNHQLVIGIVFRSTCEICFCCSHYLQLEEFMGCIRWGCGFSRTPATHYYAWEHLKKVIDFQLFRQLVMDILTCFGKVLTKIKLFSTTVKSWHCCCKEFRPFGVSMYVVVISTIVADKLDGKELLGNRSLGFLPRCFHCSLVLWLAWGSLPSAVLLKS